MKTTYFLIFFLSLLPTVFFAQNCNDDIHEGDITFYGGVAGSSGGNCSLPVAVDDFMHCALNDIDYDMSNACGACLEVTGSKGKAIVQVVDRCPECKVGDVDLTMQAFSKVEDPVVGRIKLSWKFVECPFNKTIKVNFKEENRFFNAIQFRDIKHAVSSMEYREKESDPWQNVSRTNFNFFIESSEITYPIDLRVTSILEEKLIFEDIVQRPASEEFDTLQQFSTPESCNSVLSIDSVNNTKQKTLVIYPNPSKDSIKIKGVFKNWVLTNSKGMFLQSGIAKEVIIASYPKGVYFLKIDNQTTHKIVKE